MNCSSNGESLIVACSELSSRDGRGSFFVLFVFVVYVRLPAGLFPFFVVLFKILGCQQFTLATA